MNYKNCPICDKEITYFHDTIDGHIVLEHWGDCPDLHYQYWFQTGYTNEIVMGKGFLVEVYNKYDDPELEANQRLVKGRIKKFRKIYQLLSKIGLQRIMKR
jgi:hypothetical protein